MAKELTLSAIANIGCAAALDVGRWNACTAWEIYEIAADRTRVFIRLHDRLQSPPLSRTIPVCRAYDMDGPADGTTKEIELPEHLRNLSAWDIKAFIIPQLLELAHGR